MRPDPSYGLVRSAEAFDVAEQLGRVHQLDVLCVQSALRAVRRARSTACCCSSTSRPRRSTSMPRAATGCARRSKAAGLLAGAGRDRGDRALRRTHRGGREVHVAAARAGVSRPRLDNVGTGNSGLEMLRQRRRRVRQARPLDRDRRADRPERPRGAAGDGDVRPPDRLVRDRRGGRRRGDAALPALDRRARSARRGDHPGRAGRRTRVACDGDPQSCRPRRSRLFHGHS